MTDKPVPCALCGTAPEWRNINPVYAPQNGGTMVNTYDPSWVCPNCGLASMPDQLAVRAIFGRQRHAEHTKLWNEAQLKLLRENNLNR